MSMSMSRLRDGKEVSSNDEGSTLRKREGRSCCTRRGRGRRRRRVMKGSDNDDDDASDFMSDEIVTISADIVVGDDGLGGSVRA